MFCAAGTIDIWLRYRYWRLVVCDWLWMFCVAGMIEKSAVNGLTDYFRNLCEYFTQ